MDTGGSVAEFRFFRVFTGGAFRAGKKLASKTETFATGTRVIVNLLADFLVTSTTATTISAQDNGLGEAIFKIWNCVNFSLHFFDCVPLVPARIAFALHLLVAVSAFLVASAVNHFAPHTEPRASVW